MSAWLLAALFCAPVSAQVFETGGAAAPVAPVSGSIGASMGAGATVSPITAVPGAASLAPSLNSAVISAFPGQAATNVPAGAVRFAPAPLPALPAAAATSAAAAPVAPHQDAPGQTNAAPSRRDLVPPAAAAGASALPAVAAVRRRASDSDASPEGASIRFGAAGRELAAPLNGAAGLDPISAEAAAALGRKVFDRAGDRALLADGSAAGAPGAPAAGDGSASSARRDPLLAAFAGGTIEGENLRDAVASPIPAAAPAAAFSFFKLPASLLAPSRGGVAGPASGAAPAAAPITFERLSLELRSGLVVKVRAILGLPPTAAALRADGAAKPTAAAGAYSSRRPRVPITSTEWLERRGLLESISASEAAASQEAASLLPPEFAATRASAPAPALARASASASRTAALPALVLLDPAVPRVPPWAWWALALMPAGFVLLKELL